MTTKEQTAQTDAAKQYIHNLHNKLKAGDATEHTHRPALITFLESLEKKITATNEPKQSDCGAPDYKVTKTPGPVTIGYIEAKDIGIPLAQTQKSNQLKRYRRALPNLILTDYLHFKWFVNGEPRGEATLGTVNEKTGKINTDQNSIDATLQLLKDFLAQDPAPLSKPKDLAERMARITHMIRDIIVEAYAQKQASTLITDLRKVMAQVLIPDLNKPEKTSDFADLYAQTLTYGLFAARCNHNGPTQFTRRNAASEIPKTNPFLRDLFDTITGSKLDTEPYVGFVDDLVAILANVRIKEILQDFGSAAFEKDPVLHFYETFLSAYDPKLRESRGVYYTPEPVVNYIVRSVDHLLKTRFNITEGLADTEKFTYEHDKVDKSTGKTVVEQRELHRTLILDPAAGTGTFLYTVIAQIRARYEKMKKAGMWSGYVHEHLLPRIFGFELLMAPYAVAHFKLAMQLAGLDLHEKQREIWAYDFASDERLGVYLTNTLESVDSIIHPLLGPFRIISEEAEAAKKVKRDLPILVVLGNPPYSGISSNKGKWIDNLLKGKTPGKAATANYYQVDGKPLGERNPKWLQDDYVKFIRWAQWRIDQSGHGILAFITNHGYIDNPTFRGMRQSLMQSFDEIYILDLHGNLKKKETASDGSSDQNVFDIQQGVAISLFVKLPKTVARASRPCIHHAEIHGKRKHKYEWLHDHTIQNTKWTELNPEKPFYLFRPYDAKAGAIYYNWHSVKDVFPVNGVGIVTARDQMVIDFEDNPIIKRVKTFRDSQLSDRDVCQSLNIPLKKGWDYVKARDLLRHESDLHQFTNDILYRPFDTRRIFYHPSLVWRMVDKVMLHMLERENYSLISARSNKFSIPDHFFCAKTIVETKCGEASTQSCTFPLYAYSECEKHRQYKPDDWPEVNDRRPNLDPTFVNQLANAVKLTFITDGRGDLKKTFGPEDVLHYIYAIFHCPTYRTRYAEFLKLDFPRVPITSDKKQFVKLCILGHEVMSLHLLESETLTGDSIAYPITGQNNVEKGYPKYVPPGAAVIKAGKTKLEPHKKHGRVYINPDQFFEGIEHEVWTFQIGGYQVCNKWLKDRRGRTLTHDEINKYTKIIESLRRTIQLMAEIDKTIPTWPIE